MKASTASAVSACSSRSRNAAKATYSAGVRLGCVADPVAPPRSPRGRRGRPPSSRCRGRPRRSRRGPRSGPGSRARTGPRPPAAAPGGRRCAAATRRGCAAARARGSGEQDVEVGRRQRVHGPGVEVAEGLHLGAVERAAVDPQAHVVVVQACPAAVPPRAGRALAHDDRFQERLAPAGGLGDGHPPGERRVVALEGGLEAVAARDVRVVRPQQRLGQVAPGHRRRTAPSKGRSPPARPTRSPRRTRPPAAAGGGARAGAGRAPRTGAGGTPAGAPSDLRRRRGARRSPGQGRDGVALLDRGRRREHLVPDDEDGVVGRPSRRVSTPRTSRSGDAAAVPGEVERKDPADDHVHAVVQRPARRGRLHLRPVRREQPQVGDPSGAPVDEPFEDDRPVPPRGLGPQESAGRRARPAPSTSGARRGSKRCWVLTGQLRAAQASSTTGRPAVAGAAARGARRLGPAASATAGRSRTWSPDGPVQGDDPAGEVAPGDVLPAGRREPPGQPRPGRARRGSTRPGSGRPPGWRTPPTRSAAARPSGTRCRPAGTAPTSARRTRRRRAGRPAGSRGASRPAPPGCPRRCAARRRWSPRRRRRRRTAAGARPRRRRPVRAAVACRPAASRATGRSGPRSRPRAANGSLDVPVPAARSRTRSPVGRPRPRAPPAARPGPARATARRWRGRSARPRRRTSSRRRRDAWPTWPGPGPARGCTCVVDHGRNSGTAHRQFSRAVDAASRPRSDLDAAETGVVGGPGVEPAGSMFTASWVESSTGPVNSWTWFVPPGSVASGRTTVSPLSVHSW